MHEGLQKEIAIYEKRTPKSAEAHARALKRIPLGVASNYRAYDPYPIFVKEGKGSKIRDIDGNEYIDHNLCFGALPSACRTTWSGSLRRKSARDIRWRWCASGPAGRR